MANFSATSSGDFSSYLAGKVLNAANMAKGEKNRREEANLERAQPEETFIVELLVFLIQESLMARLIEIRQKKQDLRHNFQKQRKKILMMVVDHLDLVRK